jgi:DnaJ like chaperone protein
VRGAVAGRAKAAGPASAPRAAASAGSASREAGEPSAQRVGQRATDAADEARSPHEVLGVDPSASADEVRAAYQRLARAYHPDRVEGLAPELRELAHRRMVEINRAFEALSRGGEAR